MHKKEFDEALSLLERAIKLNPENSTAMRHLLIYNQQVIEPLCKSAATAYFSGQFPEALKIWNRIITQSPSESTRLQPLIDNIILKSRGDELKRKYAVVDILINDGRNKEAENELESILREFPHEADAKRMLADISGSLNSNIMREHYTNALDSIEEGEFDKALRELNAILVIEPEHSQAKKLIVTVSRMKLKDTYDKADEFLRDGQYLKAKQAYETALRSNPSDTAMATTLQRLEEITRLAASISGSGPEVRLMKKSLYNYASAGGSVKVSVAAAWYANQLAPENPRTEAVRNFIEEKNHQVLRLLDPPARDMNIVDQKLFAALNYIYEGRYDLTVEECSIVLELSPNNILALKRMGSAYFLLGKKSQAEKVWKRALKLTPNDEELKGFLRSL
jgi:tetratricopeptide (TPR) repeat protein